MGKRMRALGTASAAAESLGVHRSTVSRQLRKMGKSESTRIGKRTQAVGSATVAQVKARLRPSRKK